MLRFRHRKSQTDVEPAPQPWTEVDREFFEGHDAEENLNSKPPTDEHVVIRSIWVSECFTPALIDNLLHSVRRLGWDNPLLYGFGSQAPIDKWIEQYRWSAIGGAWYPLNHIRRREDQSGWSSNIDFRADFPPVVERAIAHLHHLFPGVFVIAIQFVLKPECSSDIDDALNKEYKTRIEPHERGWRGIGPVTQKRDAVDAIRRRLRRECIGWTRETFPGVFAHTDDPAAYPTCELLTMDMGEPGKHKPGYFLSYLWVLRVEDQFDSYISDTYKGMYLLLESHRDLDNRVDDLALVLAANFTQALLDDDLTPYGGRMHDGIVNRLHYFEGPMTEWTLHALIKVYERKYASIREEVALAVGEDDLSEAVAAITAVEGALLQVASDALSLMTEMAEFCNHSPRIPGGGGAFRRVHPLRFSSPPSPRVPEPLPPLSPPEPRGWAVISLLVKRRRTRAKPLAPLLLASDPVPPPIPKIVEEPDLFESIRRELVRRCERLQRTESVVRQLVQSGSSAVNARAQQRLSESNLSLQRQVLILSLIVLILAAVQVWLAWLAYRAMGH